VKKYTCTLLLCLFVLSSSAIAEAESFLLPYNYVVAKLGIYSPTSNDLNGFSTGFNGELAFGHYLNPYFAIELGVGYAQTNGDVTVVYPYGAKYPGSEKIEITPLTASLRLSYPVNRWVELYGIGGIGAYFVNDHIDISNHGEISDNTTAFGGQLGGGINFNLTTNFFIGAECKYVWTTASLYGADVNLGGVRATGNFGVRF
jgi:opacity protein-like surface antigen